MAIVSMMVMAISLMMVIAMNGYTNGSYLVLVMVG